MKQRWRLAGRRSRSAATGLTAATRQRTANCSNASHDRGCWCRSSRRARRRARKISRAAIASISGSLITARLAGAQGREVFAVPGSPLNPLAAGCLELIRQGAQLARNAADILPEIGITIEQETRDPQARLDAEYDRLLGALGFEPATVDDLVERTGLPAGSIASMMLILELEGRVQARPGALYNRIT
jgi:DNA processing protein